MSRAYFSAEVILVHMFGAGNIEASKASMRFSGDDAMFVNFLRVNKPERYENAMASLESKASSRNGSAKVNLGPESTKDANCYVHAFSASEILSEMYGAENVMRTKAAHGKVNFSDVEFLEYMRTQQPTTFNSAIESLDAKRDSRNGIAKAKPATGAMPGQPDNPARPKASRAFVDSPKDVADACSLIDGKMDKLCGAMNSFVDALALLEAGIAGVVRPEGHTASVGDTSPVPPKPNQSRIAHSLDDLIGQMNRATDRVNSLSERIEF